jgi:hypothetical protein
MNRFPISPDPSRAVSFESVKPFSLRTASGFSALLLGVVLALGAVADARAEPAQEQSIQKRVQAYLAAWSSDAKPATREHLGRFYLRTTELIVFDNVAGKNTVATGWAALRDLNAGSLQDLATVYRQGQLKPAVQLHGDTAWVHLVGNSARSPGASSLSEAAANVTQAWQYRDGAWVIVYEHIATSDSPVKANI